MCWVKFISLTGIYDKSVNLICYRVVLLCCLQWVTRIAFSQSVTWQFQNRQKVMKTSHTTLFFDRLPRCGKRKRVDFCNNSKLLFVEIKWLTIIYHHNKTHCKPMQRYIYLHTSALTKHYIPLRLFIDEFNLIWIKQITYHYSPKLSHQWRIQAVGLWKACPVNSTSASGPNDKTLTS